MEELPLDSLFFPSRTPSKKLMIVLHGRGDSAEGFRFLPKELGFDDLNYLLINAPIEYYTGFSWYDLPPNQLPGIQYSRSVLTQLLDKVFEGEFEPSQTLLFGFSQGALLTFEFGARYHHALAGYVGISGYIYDAQKILLEMNPLVNQSNWLCTHGTIDDVLYIGETREQIKALQNGGFKIDYREYRKTHTIDTHELLEIKEWIQSRLS